MSRTLSGLFLVGAVRRPRKEEKCKSGKSPDNPRTNRENPKKSGKSQKDKKGQKRQDKSRSGNPPYLKPPRHLPALEIILDAKDMLLIQMHLLHVSSDFSSRPWRNLPPTWVIRIVTRRPAHKRRSTGIRCLKKISTVCALGAL